MCKIYKAVQNGNSSLNELYKLIRIKLISSLIDVLLIYLKYDIEIIRSIVKNEGPSQL